MMGVNWTAVIAGAVVAYMLGWLWYSEKMFAVKWREGIKLSPDDNSSMLPAMVAQAVGTFLLAWVVGITETTNNIGLAILIELTIAVLMKAGGLFSQKSRYAIMVDSGYVLAMVAVMIAAQALL